STMTSGNYVTLQDDGNFVMYNPSTSAPWSANTAYLRGYELCPGTNLTANQFIQTTGEYNDQVEGLLTFNSNCTLELESGKDWSTPTATNEAGKKGNSLNPSIVASGGYDGCYAVMQTDGNLVIYAPNYPGGGIALWASNTAGNPGAMLLLQQDGCQGCDANASIYSTNGALLAGYPDDKTGTSVGFQGGNTAGSVGKFFTKLLLS
ncbi:MAG: serine protease, partial [Actinomycetota bacterium]|nr:serine protease [Actinomycetota bacterium]